MPFNEKLLWVLIVILSFAGIIILQLATPKR